MKILACSESKIFSMGKENPCYELTSLCIVLVTFPKLQSSHVTNCHYLSTIFCYCRLSIRLLGLIVRSSILLKCPLFKKNQQTERYKLWINGLPLKPYNFIFLSIWSSSISQTFQGCFLNDATRHYNQYNCSNTPHEICVFV